MKKVKILLLSLASSVGAFATDFDVTPGNLSAILPDGGKGQTEIKLKGHIDARDLAAFENLSSDVKTLDLKEVRIDGFSTRERIYFGRTLFNENEIPGYTFFNIDVEKLILPENLQIVGDGAFAGSKIKSLTLPDGVLSIGDYAFYGCKGLKEVVLPSSLKKIGKGSFGNCVELESIDLTATGITEIPSQTFAGAVNLFQVIMPASVSKIGREAFTHTKIETLDLSRVVEFEEYALSGMPFVKTLAINPEARINEGLLMDNVSLVSLSGTPDLLPDYFVANCVSLPTKTGMTATSLGKYSLANTLSPETLIMTGTISDISRGALSGLGNIKTIDVTALEGNLPVVDEFSFEGLDQSAISLLTTEESISQWEADPYWSRFNIVGSQSSSVDKIGTGEADGPTIKYAAGELVIESGSILTNVRIYTADGRVAYIASPEIEKMTIATSSLPSGILVVTASDASGNTKTASLLLK